MNLQAQKIRNRFYKKIRNFFDNSGYLEVETPLLSGHLIPESSIENFKTTLISPYKESQDLYLTPSPEIWMKVLLSKGSGDIYQISKCFRNSEQISSIHNPEFSMLEWYKLGIDAEENISVCEQLINSLKTEKTPASCLPPFRRLTMEEAFIQYAGFSLEENIKRESLYNKAHKLGLSDNPDEGWEVLFHQIFLTLVEPSLPQDKPLVLTHYPKEIKTLAKEVPLSPWSQRWELYMEGVEIANCYTEEDDPKLIEQFYKEETKEKKRLCQVDVATDQNYQNYFKTFPPCSGGAIGLDRLICKMEGYKDIRGVILFPLDDILLPTK